MAHNSRVENLLTKSRAGFQSIEWMAVRFEAPASWSIIRHSLAPDRGSLALADRYHQRMQLTWTQCRQRPDLPKMIADHRTKQRELATGALFRPLADIAGWQGLSRPQGDNRWLTRAAHYDDASKRLIEVNLLTPEPEAGGASLLPHVLESVAVQGDAREARRWCAYGLDVAVPERWRLAKALVQPADVSLKFRWIKPGASAPGKVTRKSLETTIRRLGMAESWYRDAEHFYAMRGSIWQADFQQTRFAGHAATAVRGFDQGPPMKRKLGWLRERRDLLWLCERDNAVYQIQTLSPTGSPVEPGDFRIRCCRWTSEGLAS